MLAGRDDPHASVMQHLRERAWSTDEVPPVCARLGNQLGGSSQLARQCPVHLASAVSRLFASRPGRHGLSNCGKCALSQSIFLTNLVCSPDVWLTVTGSNFIEPVAISVRGPSCLADDTVLAERTVVFADQKFRPQHRRVGQSVHMSSGHSCTDA